MKNNKKNKLKQIKKQQNTTISYVTTIQIKTLKKRVLFLINLLKIHFLNNLIKLQ